MATSLFANSLADIQFQSGAEQMLYNREGRRIPEVNFRMFIRICSEVCWYNLSTAELFANKVVVVFAVPGAFIHPSSPLQLFGYNKYAGIFQANGIDEILCISINDPFSLAKWAQTEGADRVRLIPDTEGDFTRAMGMLVNLSDRGMGQRSWRYSMLVKDGMIEKMFIERDGFEVMPVVTNAETMLNYIHTSNQGPEQKTVIHL